MGPFAGPILSRRCAGAIRAMRSQAARQASSDACAPANTPVACAAANASQTIVAQGTDLFSGPEVRSDASHEPAPGPPRTGTPLPGDVQNTRSTYTETTHVQTRIARRPVPSRAGRRKPAADHRRHQRQPCAAGQARRLPRHLPVGRRRRRRLAGPAGPGHQHHGRRADRRAPHHRRVRRAAAGRHRHRLRSVGLQHRPHGQEPDQVRRGRLPHRGPGRRQALRPPSRQKSSAPRKWPTA